MIRNRPKLRTLVTLLVLAMPSIQAEDAVPNAAAEERFLAAVASARSAMQAGRWSEARAALLRTLDDHARAPYVLARRAALRDDVAACALRMAVPEPAWSTLVSGDLRYFDPTARRIWLRYTGENLGDFERGAAVLAHPMWFIREHSVEIVGRRRASSGPIIRWSVDDGGCGIEVRPGWREESKPGPRRHDRTPREKGETVALLISCPPFTFKGTSFPTQPGTVSESRSRLAPSGKFHIKVTWAPGRVSVQQNGVAVLTAEHDSIGAGRLAVLGLEPDEIESIELRGQVDPSWLIARRDEALREREAEYREESDPTAGVPSWLLPASAERAVENLPWSFDRDGLAFMRSAYAALERSDARVARDLLEALNEDPPIGAEPRIYLRACALVRAMCHEEAAAVLDDLVARHPGSRDLRALYWTALFGAGRSETLHAAIEAALDVDSDDPIALQFEAMLASESGRLDDALRVLGDAAARGVADPELARLEEMFTRAERGPRFTRRIAKDTEHYSIASDTTPELVAEAGAAIEAVWPLLVEEFGAPRDARRTKVFLFASRAGYDAYAVDLFGAAHELTQGTYAPLVRQICVWNDLEQQELLHAIRHEAVHAYIHAQGLRFPLWVEEGLAEWIAAASQKDGVISSPVRGDYISLLGKSTGAVAGALPTAKFIDLLDGEFAALGVAGYAQAWATMWTLRSPGFHIGPSTWDRLLEAIRTGHPPRESVRRAFRKSDPGFIDESIRLWFVIHPGLRGG